MWIARDKDGRIHLFYDKPKRTGSFWLNRGYNVFHSLTGNKGQVEIDDYLYPEITFENSPKELIVK